MAFANTASTPQVFTNVIAGTNATETITNDPPHARFTATQVSGYVFRFDGTGSTDSDGSIKGYYWDFGDGTQDLNFTGGVISMHDFSPSAASAPFNVTLRVVDDQGATGAARDSIGKRLDIVPVSDVFGTPQPSHTFLTVLSDEPPTANFTVSPTNPLIGDTVMFNGSASSDPDGSIAGFSWNFGDSSSLGSGAIPTHSYTTAGTYQVTLTVTDSSGFMTMLTKSLVVEEPATIILTTSASPTSGQPVTLTISASDPDGTVSIIKIDWGDGTVDSLSGSSTSGSHTYAKSGAFTITVSVTDSSGVITSKTTLITVAAPGLGLLLYAAIGIVGVVVAVGALFFLRRRRGKPSTPPTSGPSKG